jgi:hypothetical protein
MEKYGEVEVELHMFLNPAALPPVPTGLEAGYDPVPV